MKYELKNIKTLNTSNGVAWTATVYKDGKRIGTAEDRGDGGSAWLYVKNYAEELELTAWCAEACKNSGLWMAEYANKYGTVHHVGGEKDGEQTWEMSFNTEMALAYLMEVYELDKKAKKYMVFRVSRGIDPRIGEQFAEFQMKGLSMAVARPSDIASALAYIVKKYPTAQVWDFRDHAYSDASAMLDAMRDYLPSKVGA